MRIDDKQPDPELRLFLQMDASGGVDLKAQKGAGSMIYSLLNVDTEGILTLYADIDIAGLHTDRRGHLMSVLEIEDN